MTALTLARKKLPNVKIVLVSNTPHFEYHAALYRLVTGRSPFEVCVPLAEIFDPSAGSGLESVEIVEDTIDNVVIDEKICWGVSGSKYRFDYLVLGLGSETTYYDTPGLKEYSFGFKTINEALKLKRHLHATIDSCKLTKDKTESTCNAHIVVVGGGASGTELAAELAVYMKQLALSHGIDPSFVTVDLIQSPNRLLPDLPENMSRKVEERIRSLGVNVYVNRRLVKGELEDVFLKDMQMKAKTVVWTAGVVANSLYAKTKGLETNEQGKVLVDKYMRAKGQKRVFIVGDGAVTEFSGMAQTALADGRVTAENIAASIKDTKKIEYTPHKPAYAIPVGPGWSATIWHGFEFYGRVGWWLRRLADLRLFLTLLPPKKAIAAFAGGMRLSESCSVCTEQVVSEALGKH